MTTQEPMMYQNIVQEYVPDFVPWAKIKVLGIWWCGNKSIDRMIIEWLDNIEFVAINTDAQDLSVNHAQIKVNIGLNLTKWLWAGGEPDIGRKAAEESESEIKEALKDTDMVFITAGMWWWTGTGAAPVIANIARSMGILTIGIVTKPFGFEWKKRAANAEEGLLKIKEAVDTLIVIPNDRLLAVCDKKTTMPQAFAMIDKILYLGVQWISDIIIRPGMVNIDFEDVKRAMSNSGNALLGIGYWTGEKRTVEAARRAIENPLLETNLDGAKKIIFVVAWGVDLTLFEVQEASAIIEDIKDPDAEIFWGMTIDEDFEDEVKVTIIATGFEVQKDEQPRTAKSMDMFGQRQKTSASKNAFTDVLQWASPKTAYSTRWNNQPAFDHREVYSEQEELAEKPIFQLEPKDDEETPAFMAKRLHNTN